MEEKDKMMYYHAFPPFSPSGNILQKGYDAKGCIIKAIYYQEYNATHKAGLSIMLK